MGYGELAALAVWASADVGLCQRRKQSLHGQAYNMRPVPQASVVILT